MLQVEGLNQYYGGSHILRNLGFEAKLGELGGLSVVEAGRRLVEHQQLRAGHQGAHDLDELPEGSSALVLAIEHMWAVPLRDAVRDAGGVVLSHRSLTAEDLIAFGMDLGDAAEEELED